MSWKIGKPGWMTRRELFGAASATAAGMTAWSLAGASRVAAQKAPGKHEPLENFKYDIEASEGWVGEAGSAKEANVSEFPVSKSLAGVSMRLKPGGLRELHWHATAAEWAYVVEGNVRTTVIAPNGQAESADFGPGDVWYFPKGHGHALQCLGPGDAHFVLVFDDGEFSEFGTFSITDWLGHTPAAVVSRNLATTEAVAAGLPKQELYITPGKIPPAIPENLRNGDPLANQSPHKFRLGAMKPMMFPGGEERIVSSVEFPIQKTVTGVVQDLKPGALRELHWHPNADEWQFYLAGQSRVTIFGAHGRTATEEFKPGQVAFIRQGFGHFVEQVGDEPTRILIVFNSPVYEEISISGWLAANPPSLIADNFKLTPEQVSRLPKSALGILG
ncbi:MAG TPA: cupin domain-containing protein [Candidatus Limnocylindrales bacterium]|nr:cupin domain-containing protein [Candidatus Limnocylindrales bacterium]